MTDRKPVFDAIRPLLSRAMTSADVTAINALLDTLTRERGVTLAVLRAACPERSEAQLAPWIDPVRSECAEHGIVTARQQAAFVSQMAHEFGFVAGLRENMGYTAQRMAEVWPGRYAVPGVKPYQPNALARALDRKPEALANNVYANRLGNGAPETGDGWRFRAAGPGITGRANFAAFGRTIGMTAEDAVAYTDTVPGAVAAFAWYWSENDINRLAETPGVEDETRKINGGTIGLADRKARFDRALAALERQV